MNQKNPPNESVDKPMVVPPRGHRAHGEALVDEAVAETLPASDPISPYSAQQSRPVALAQPAERSGTPVESAPAWNGWTRAEDAPRDRADADEHDARPRGRGDDSAR
jgi:hypothetical protein